MIYFNYSQLSNRRHTKSQNVIVSHLILQLFLPNPSKPGVKPLLHFGGFCRRSAAVQKPWMNAVESHKTQTQPWVNAAERHWAPLVAVAEREFWNVRHRAQRKLAWRLSCDCRQQAAFTDAPWRCCYASMRFFFNSESRLVTVKPRLSVLLHIQSRLTGDSLRFGTTLRRSGALLGVGRQS